MCLGDITTRRVVTTEFRPGDKVISSHLRLQALLLAQTNLGHVELCAADKPTADVFLQNARLLMEVAS